MPDTIFQYAVKVVQGGITLGEDRPIGPGIYFTSVNVHNPWRYKAIYAVKVGTSGLHGDPGAISSYQCHELGPDAATEYDYEDFGSPEFLEGYCVIESEQELDVVGVYTGSDASLGRLEAMHLERVPVRIVPRCQDLTLDISTGVGEWQLTAVPTGSSLTIDNVPTRGRWARPTGSALWVGSSNLTEYVGEYTYELSFFLCWTFENALMTFELWADDSAELFLNGSPTDPPTTVGSPPYKGTGLAVEITTGFLVGMNKLTVVATNNGGPTGILLKGTLSADAADCGP